ncbi:MAG: hypothetical protein AB1505_31845 [Candidatus Latescibacterota bacterium]
MNRRELMEMLGGLYTVDRWPKPFHVLQALDLVAVGTPVAEAARLAGTTAATLTKVADAEDPVRVLLGLALNDVDNGYREKARQIVGQLLLGRCAELAFERLYRSEMPGEEFELRDERVGRTDTDYRVLNGKGRPVYRVNIKFHGSRFRRSQELVGLEPADCFALATYKIHAALQKQTQDELPYFFAIVGVPDLTGAVVGNDLPSLLVETVALVAQAKAGSVRGLEDAAVNYLVCSGDAAFGKTLDRIQQADWYVLSARRAHMLLRRLLFERVYALRIRNFARAFGGAELDMHFSLSQDLIPLRQFLTTQSGACSGPPRRRQAGAWVGPPGRRAAVKPVHGCRPRQKCVPMRRAGSPRSSCGSARRGGAADPAVSTRMGVLRFSGVWPAPAPAAPCRPWVV